jgi:hypothetical protein
VNDERPASDSKPAPARKAAARSQPARPRKKASTSKSDDDSRQDSGNGSGNGSGGSSSNGSGDQSGQESGGGRKLSASRIATMAAASLAELTGRQPEGVTGLQRTDDGWTVTVEALELHRVPETTDVLASYEVQVDTSGELLGYHRVRRYVRGTAGEDGP